MRAIGRRINYPNHFLNSTTPFSLQSASSFCSGSGHGRGRGRGLPPTPFQFTDTKPPPPDQPDTESKPDPPPTGLGHGRGRVLPAFSPFISSAKGGAGRGQSVPEPDHPSQPTEWTQPSKSNLPSGIPSVLGGAGRGHSVSEPEHPSQPIESTQPSEPKLPSSIRSVLASAGRGKPGAKQLPPQPVSAPPIKEEENRHIRARPRPQQETKPAGPKMSKEDAVKHAVRILSQGDEGKGGRGVGRGGGRGRGRGRRGGRGFHRVDMGDNEEGYDSGLYVGDDADGEKLANKLGVENMNKLVEGFEELGYRLLPDPIEDAYIDALDTNYMIECEPEYLMEEFGTNPDIDEEPPIPLRDALEKMKPFLMAYEGIQSQEEWEQAINEVMERVPLLKEIVDHYSGPDRVTAKQQQQELERVANTIPERAPAYMKRFANRAVLSLQSNPGWGFDKKCQFMDKLVLEVSQLHK